MIHGKTKIELYNPNTKIKQILREENTFQSSVLANYMRGLGEANNNPYANATFRSSKSWQNLVGGIFLFKNSIDTSGGVVKYMPGGNQMIANGSYGVSNGSSENDPTEMGSFNADESSASASAITQVYDWETNQGNGTIGCICLTSQTGGYIGYGNESGKVKSPYDIKRNQNYQTIDATNSAFGYSTVIGNIKYSFSLSNGILTVRKTKVAILQADIFNGFYTEDTFELSDIGNHLSLVSQYMIPIIDGTDIYLIPSKNQIVSANDTAYFYKYDTTNDTLTEIDFTNSSTATIFIYRIVSGWGEGIECNIANGLFLAHNANSKISVFNFSTGLYVEELAITDSTAPYGGRNFASAMPNGLIFIRDSNSNEFIYDSTLGTLKSINASPQVSVVNNNNVISYDGVNDALVYQGGIYLYKVPMYLATINNLQSPVTKTAAQTMKVTYTLTEA